MKTKKILALILCIPILMSCKGGDNAVSGIPVIKCVVSAGSSDTITSAAYNDWITIVGNNFVNVKSIYVNDVEISPQKLYLTKNEITFQIPSTTPGKVNNLITIQTNSGTATLPFTVILPAPIVVPDRVASWLFDDPSNLLKASVGQDLKTGWRENASVTHIPSPNVMTGFTPISGPDNDNKALTVDKSYFLVANHGISPNGGGTKVNEYTLMIDFRAPVLGTWYTFMQTNPADDSDGDIFINKTGGIGRGVTGYSNSGMVIANTWQRLVVSVKLGSKGWIKYYIDGSLVLNITDMTNFQIDDNSYSLGPQLLLFADNDGDDANIDVAGVAMWNVALNESQVEKIGELDGWTMK
jgi:hypothetical protein